MLPLPNPLRSDRLDLNGAERKIPGRLQPPAPQIAQSCWCKRERSISYHPVKFGQQPSSSCRPVRCRQPLSSKRWATSFQIACGPQNRIASVFRMSTTRKHRRHSTRNTSRGTSDNRSCPTGSHGLPAARGSASTFCHHSSGGWLRVRLVEESPIRACSLASVSICLAFGMRHDAGRSFMTNG